MRADNICICNMVAERSNIGFNTLTQKKYLKYELKKLQRSQRNYFNS